MTRKLIVCLAALGLVMSSIGVAIGAQQQRPDRKYNLRDGEVTSAAETGPDHGEEAADSGPGGQHGEIEGHLPRTRENMKLISKLRLTETAGAISDVNYGNGHAYLGAYHPACDDTTGLGGGVHIVDIRDPQNPQKVAFAPSPVGNYVSEGVDFLRRKVNGVRQDLLLMSNEACTVQSQTGGTTIYDVTDPSDPKLLNPQAGDFIGDDGTTVEPRANYTHSVMGWNDDGRTYAVQIDNEEALDVDIIDITNPATPILVSETGLPEWPDAEVNGLGGTVFHHDAWVEEIDGVHYLMASYWDAGHVLLNVENPENPVFIDDSNFPDPDSLTGLSPPEGNAHQGTWSEDDRFFIGTDEDFSPYRLEFRITSGPNAGEYPGGEFGFTVPIVQNFGDKEMNGPTVYGGTGCNTDPVPPASEYTGEAPGEGEELIVVLTRGGCFFSDKIRNAEDAGYKAVIIGNSHFGSNYGEQPDAPVCGSQGSETRETASAACIGHRAMHLIFNDNPEYQGAEGSDLPPKGTPGEEVSANAQFDGWGYVRLLNADTLEEIDAYAVEESLDERFASGFGHLSVHEVKADHREGSNLAYLSYYAAGARVIRSSDRGIKEMGSFIDRGGNDFWGVFPVQRGDDRPLLLFSDRDFGLYILKYTGPEPGEIVSRGACKGFELGSRTNRAVGGGQVIVGTPGNDVLTGTAGDDIICGLGGNDIIDGNGGQDEIVGNAGDDTISGGNGKDSIRGNAGRDAIDGNDGNDVILGNAGIDTLRGNGGWDTIKGGGGRDSLQGGEGNDVLRGGTENDTLKGFEGSDILDGEAGTDTCDGGAGHNTLRSCER